MLKFYECKVCDVPCIGMPHDGEIYKEEVCSPECLVQLQSAQQGVLAQADIDYLRNFLGLPPSGELIKSDDNARRYY